MRQSLVLSAIVAVASAAAFEPNVANAAYRTFSATACLPSLWLTSGPQNPLPSLNPAISSGPGSQVFNHCNGSNCLSQTLYCPVVSDSLFPANGPVTATVNGYANDDTSGGSRWNVRTCITYAGGFGGTCGPFTSNPGFATVVSEHPTTSGGWASGGSSDGYYIEADLGCLSSTGSANVLFSYGYSQ